MAKRRGRLRSGGKSSVLDCGAQRAIGHNDVLTLLADCGKHLVLVQRGTRMNPVPTRPAERSWALLESDALADARAAARTEARDMARSGQALVDRPLSSTAHDGGGLPSSRHGGRVTGGRPVDDDEPPHSAWVEFDEAQTQDLMPHAHLPIRPSLAATSAAAALPPPPLPARAQPSKGQGSRNGGGRVPAGGSRVSGGGTGESATDGFGNVALAYVGTRRGGRARAATRTRAVLATLGQRAGAQEEILSLELRITATDAMTRVECLDKHDDAGGRRRPRQLAASAECVCEEQLLVDLGLTLDSSNTVTAMTAYGAARDAGLQVGDVVVSLNDQPLGHRERAGGALATSVRAAGSRWRGDGSRPPTRLGDALRREHILAGESVALGIERSLSAHMDLVVMPLAKLGKTAVEVAEAAAEEEARQRAPPRMVPRDRLLADEWRARFVAAGRPLPRRDPYNNRVLSEEECANGGIYGGG